MEFWPYKLRAGHTRNPAGGACAMAAVNWLVHGKHSDRPKCACPVVGRFVMAGNDAMDDDDRQRLLPYLHRIAGSRSPEYAQSRAAIIVSAALRIWAPKWLDDAGLPIPARQLRELPDHVSAQEAFEVARQAERIALKKAMRTNTTAERKFGSLQGFLMKTLQTAKAERAANVARGAGEAIVLLSQVENASRVLPWSLSRWPAAQAILLSAVNEAVMALRAPRNCWDDYFVVLDDVLNAGPQGEPWSADFIDHGTAAYRAKGGKAVLTEA
jgi:hypothetical protein